VEEEVVSFWFALSDFGPLEISKVKQAEHCVKEHVKAKIIPKPKMSDKSGKSIPNPSYEQYGRFRNVLPFDFHNRKEKKNRGNEI